MVSTVPKEGSEYGYRRLYTFIFSFFYLIEGIHQGLPYVYPFLLMKYQENTYDAAMIMFISSATSIPWAFKFIVGFINDKWTSKKYGRRFPFIFLGGTWCAIWWLLFATEMPFFSYNTPKIYSELLFYSIMTNIGMAVADTAIDGLILDVTPKEKLGKIESITWTLLLGGSSLIGAGVGFFFLQWNILWLLFVVTGIFTIISSVLAIFVKEPPLEGKVVIKEDLKKLVTNKENLKLYVFTITESAANPIIGVLYSVFVLVSMGMLDPQETLLRLSSGGLGDLFIDTVLIQIGYGVGVVLGCFFAGRIADKNRRKSVFIGYYFYIPMCLLCVFFKGIIAGNIANAFFGLSYGFISIAGQTVRGDVAKQHFPHLKSTFFALLISISNLGLAAGNFIGGLLFKVLATKITDFDLLVFLVMSFCALILILSYYSFRAIKPAHYEFKNIIELDVSKDDK